MTEEYTTILFLIPWMLKWLALILGYATIGKWLYQSFQLVVNSIDHGHFSKHS